MKILFTNHHLQDRGGSELYCLELSTALRRAGHDVAIFTFRPGPLAAEVARRGVSVLTVGDEARIEEFSPDILHVHHAPCLYHLGALRLKAPVLFSALGVLPPLEAPPIVWEGVAQGLAVSEEVLEALRQSPFGAVVPLGLLRNWFDDSLLERPAPRPPAEAKRIAVVTNHLEAGLRQDLDALCAAHPGLEWKHFGLPENPVELVPAVLEDFDRVVTIGRTALLAAAMQKPCLLYDVHGCDGLLTAERLERLASRNFSGRLTRARPSRQELEHLLLEEARKVDVAHLAEEVWRDWTLSRRVEDLQSLHAQVLQRGVSLGEKARAAYGREGRVYAESIATLEYLSRHAADLERALGEERTRRLEQEALLEESRRQQEALREESRRWQEAERASASRVAELRQELEAEQARSWPINARRQYLESEVKRLQQKLVEIETSLAWRTVGQLRKVKDGMVAVPGSRRRQLYDSLLNRLKSPRQGGSP